MFKFIYSIGIISYSVIIWLVSFFNSKAKLWIQGRKAVFDKIEADKIVSKNVIWFHVASLGEFEQARPLIEKIKNKNSAQKILLTFFSPSGYEIRKNYKFADYIHYLPIDTIKNAQKFLKLTNPKLVIFVKYDFWYNYIEQIYKKSIPLYLVSGIFREKQIFFKKSGKSYAKLLTYFTHLFVQDDISVDLMKSIGIGNVTKTGDTRFDRVIEIAEQSYEIEIVEKFKDNKTTLVVGSSWLADEKIFTEFINSTFEDIKFIIAPHHIEENRIIELLQLLNKKVVRFSKANIETVADFQVLIIDNIGMLSSIYKYGNIAYVGGGFGTGIHNILEAAVYGMPIVFGTNYKRFNEAKEMIAIKTAFSIDNLEDFTRIMKTFLSDENFLASTSQKAKNYVYQNKGATEIVLDFIKF
jgi:3-deoxy-D-manno-octulosonic-acid transferase